MMRRRGISDLKFQISNCAAALLFCLTTTAVRAAEDMPTITVSKGDQINLTVPPLAGSDGAATTKIVQNDLALAGYFALGGANSTYTVRGTASGGSLQGQVVDTVAGRFFPKPIRLRRGARAQTRTNSRTTSSRR